MLNALFYFLLKNPQCLRRLEAEVLSVRAAVEQLSDDCLARLPYLNACINETFRITPAFNGGILQRVSCGATVDGIYVPPGVRSKFSTFKLDRCKHVTDIRHLPGCGLGRPLYAGPCPSVLGEA